MTLPRPDDGHTIHRLSFALLGAAGYVAPRHLQAIKDIGGVCVAALDPHDSVGILDRYFPDCAFFTEFERFDRHIRKNPVDFVSICTPNYLHATHIAWARDRGASVIVEKPAFLNPKNAGHLDPPPPHLMESTLDIRTRPKVFVIHQLRLHPAVQNLKTKLMLEEDRVSANFTTITPRGQWYDWSWKGDETKSGGLEMNIGVHIFDLMLYLFGPLDRIIDVERSPKRTSGLLEFERATVAFMLATEGEPLRRITIGDDHLDLTGFEDLHTKVYHAALRGKGCTLDDALPSIELVRRIQHHGNQRPAERRPEILD